MRPLDIGGIGIVTPFGCGAGVSSGAILSGCRAAGDLDTIGVDGRPIVGASLVDLPTIADIERVAALAVLAVRECLAARGAARGMLPVVLCTSSAELLGGDPRDVLAMVAASVGNVIDIERSVVLSKGRDAMIEACVLIGERLDTGAWPSALLIAADSVVTRRRARFLDTERRRLPDSGLEGTFPGEAAAALWLQSDAGTQARARWLSFSGGAATHVQPPSSGAVVGVAAERALADARIASADVSAVAYDGCGPATVEEVVATRSRPGLCAAASARTLALCESVGDAGAASGLLGLATLAFLTEQGALERPSLAVFSGEGSARGAAVIGPATRRSRKPA